MEKKIDSFGQIDYWLLENGILEFRLAEGLSKAQMLSLDEVLFTQQLQQRLYQERKEKLRVLARLDSISSMSKEAKNFARTDEGLSLNKITMAYALLAPNLITRMLGSVLVRIYGQDYPIKLFTNREQAIEWLLSLSED
ncbi:STAS/SEC14 domain-containing protein [Saprospira sp. CCB-QB6]|uniref:DUF7793 family protein n=1 Tax=Saprospira sp. CCB-QB6 TaxID=3023936 RepID=UPI002349C190|nr:STAS/SEC14 domain-containing protein [Saprospira sp. CCB-QB6]WCL81914.1 STAS/SEC14 domain-containing protein [Saprospira sp. CCB-QB6]